MHLYGPEMAAKCVKMCRNGDSFFPPVNVVINPRDIRNMDAFLDRVTQVTRMRNAARRVCTPRRGHKVEDLNKLVSGEMYVAVGQEGFKTLEYDHIHIRKPALHRRELKIEPVKHSKIITSARCRKVALWESSGLKTIYVYRNGDDKQPSHKILLDRRMLLNMDKVLEHITERVKLESGAVLRLYTLHAKEVCSPSELVNGERYVAVGHGKRFKRTAYNDNQKVSPNNSPRRPHAKHKVFMQKRNHLSPTGGEFKSDKKVFAVTGVGNEVHEKATKELSRTMPQNSTVVRHEKNDNQETRTNEEDAKIKKEEDGLDHETKKKEESASKQCEDDQGESSIGLLLDDGTEKEGSRSEQPEHHQGKTIVGLGNEVPYDDVYKASGAKSEKAKPVEETKETRVEKPIDQVAAEEVVEELVEDEPEDSEQDTGVSQAKPSTSTTNNDKVD